MTVFELDLKSLWRMPTIHSVRFFLSAVEQHCLRNVLPLVDKILQRDLDDAVEHLLWK